MRLVLSLLTMAFTASIAVASEPLRLGLGGEPSTLDPHRYNLRIEETVLTDLFEGLVTFAADGQVAPGVATRWDVSEDGLTWSFALRAGARWSDGTPLGADDFVFSFRRLVNPATAASLAYFMYPIRNAQAVASGTLPPEALGVAAPDDQTLVIELEEPYPHLAERLLYPTAFPVPRHVIEQHGDAWVRPEHWVSNGAYALENWQPRNRISLRANPHFHTPPGVAQAEYIPLSSPQNALNRYLTGDVQAIGGFPPGEFERLQGERPEDLRQAILQSAIYVVFNTARPPFDDPRVRRALTLPIDPNILASKVLKGGQIAAHSLVPSIVPGYDAPAAAHSEAPLAARIREARTLLAEAGYTRANPLTVTLKHATGAPANKKASLAIAGFWRQIGVRARLHQAELRAHYADLRAGEFEVAHAAWLGEANPEHYLGLLYSGTGDTNYGRYSSAAFDALFEQARAQAEIAKRHELLRQAEVVAQADHAVVPLYTAASRRLVRPAIQGWADNARDVHPLRYLTMSR